METYRKTSLAAMLSVRNGAKAIEFYMEAFGAIVLFRMGGGSTIAQLAIHGAEFWIADESPEHQNYSPESLGGRASARMVLTVHDPDALFARAIEAGGKVVAPMEDKEYGWRIGRLVDPYGHHWEIGKPVD